MKRYIRDLVSAVLVGLLMSPAYSTLITHNDYVAGQVITASGQNANENAIIAVVNGNIDASNIAAGSVGTTQLSSAVIGQFVPTGTILWYAGAAASPPAGYLTCDGTAVSRTTYAALFALVGGEFGTGDNSTTFNLPDLMGRFIRGVDDGTGRDKYGTSRTACNSGGHTGNNGGSCEQFYTSLPSTDMWSTNTAAAQQIGALGSNFNCGSGGNSCMAAGQTSSITYTSTYTFVNNGGDAETVPVNVSLVPIIKY